MYDGEIVTGNKERSMDEILHSIRGILNGTDGLPPPEKKEEAINIDHKAPRNEYVDKGKGPVTDHLADQYQGGKGGAGPKTDHIEKIDDGVKHTATPGNAAAALDLNDAVMPDANTPADPALSLSDVVENAPANEAPAQEALSLTDIANNIKTVANAATEQQVVQDDPALQMTASPPPQQEALFLQDKITPPSQQMPQQPAENVSMQQQNNLENSLANHTEAQYFDPLSDPMASSDSNGNSNNYFDVPNAHAYNDKQGLLSEQSSHIGAEAFARLQGSVGLGNGGITLEEIVRETLHPLLKAWLDENLPRIVNNLVDREIHRISGGFSPTKN